MSYQVLCPNRINGPEFYINVMGKEDSVPDPQAIYLKSFALLDWNDVPVTGYTVEYSYVNGSIPANVGLEGLPWVGYTPAYIYVSNLPKLPAGHYTFIVTLTTIPALDSNFDRGLELSFTLPIFIAQAPLVRTYHNIPIPGLEHWRKMMVELADQWTPGIADPAKPYGDSTWYWDMCGCLWDVGDYVGANYMGYSSRYRTAALAAAEAYLEYIAPGGPAVWAVYPRGMRMTYERTQEGKYIDAIKSMSTQGWAVYGGNPDPTSMRETAMACDVWRELWWTDAANKSMLEKSVNFLLTQFNLLYAQPWLWKGKEVVSEPMFFGVAAQSLIDYFDLTQDERIPEVLAAATRYIWDVGVNEGTGYTLYDTFDPSAGSYTGLNTMMTNAWGFLYKVTGNELYRQQGDILFEHVFDDGNWQWSPKQFCQIFRRSIDYVNRWRSA